MEKALEREIINFNKKKENNISIIQFNILSSSLSTEEHFPYVKKENLIFEENRKINLMNELKYVIKKCDSNIICLQELSDYRTFFQKEFFKLGFDSVYLKRPNTHESNWSGLIKSDGLGIFYKEEMFDLIKVEEIYYQDDHDRIGLIVILNYKKTKQKIIVTTTHLYWNFNKIEVQLNELKFLEKNLENILKKEKDLQIFLCGDLNNTPDSKIYNYLLNSFLTNLNINMRSSHDCYKSKDLEDYGYDKEIEFTTYNFRRSWVILIII
jgi:CCR4-NOT transcription complex subunit 6